MPRFAPTSSYVNWPDERLGPWRLGFHWDLVDGQVECVGFDVHSFMEYVAGGKRARRRLRAGVDPRPIDTGVLRQIPLSTLIAQERMKMAGRVARIADHPGFSEGSRAEVERQLPHWQKAAGSAVGRKGYPHAHFEEVAAVYLGADGVKPTKAVQDYWATTKGWPVTKSTAAKWVARARDLGFLPEAPGRGVPTRPKRQGKE